MPPKANKPAAPKKPTKPSAKSKTGNTACSQAASNWQLSIRGKEPLDPQTYATLAKCRAMTRTAKQADDRARMGYNLNEQGAAALKGRLQKRFDQGLITQKSRDERLKMLLQQRKAKQAAVAAKPAKQADSLGTAESYISNAIQANRYADRLKSNPSAMAAFRQTTLDNWKSGVLEQAKTGRLSDDVLDSYESQFGRGSVGKTFRGVYEKGASGYFTKDIRTNQKPADKAASLVSSVRQKPGYGVARASAAGNRELVGLKMRDKGTVTTQPTFTLKQSSSQGGTGAGRSMGVLFQTEGTALDKAAQAGQKAPLAGQGSLFRGAAIDNKTTRRLEFNEAKRQAYSGTLDLSRESLKQIKIGGMEVTTSERPGIYNVFHSVTGRQMGIIDTTSGKDHRISTESYGYSEKNAQNLKKISEEMRKIKFKSELGSLASRQSTQGPSSYVFGRLSGKKSEEYRISFNPAARKIAQPETQPPKPAFSRQGQLAPGRGTETRKQAAYILNTLRKKGFSQAASMIRKEASKPYSYATQSLRRVGPEVVGSRVISAARSTQEGSINARVRLSTEAFNSLTPTGKVKVKAKDKLTDEKIKHDRTYADHAVRLGRTINNAQKDLGILQLDTYRQQVLRSGSMTRLRNSIKSTGKTESATSRPDQATVNIPLNKRPGGSLDSQIDKWKAQEAKSAKEDRRSYAKETAAVKSEARALYQTYGENLAKRTAEKHGHKIRDVKDQLDSMIKWEPRKALALLKKEAEQVAQPKPFSRGGQLAPGRGTQQRKDIAERLGRLRAKLNREVEIDRKLAKPQYAEAGPGIWKKVQYNVKESRNGFARRFDQFRDFLKLRNQAAKSTKAANRK